jgi:hypothetical protein
MGVEWEYNGRKRRFQLFRAYAFLLKNVNEVLCEIVQKIGSNSDLADLRNIPIFAHIPKIVCK